jgi:hypothetical protein
MKMKVMTVLAASLLVVGVASAAPQKVHVSPFSDSLLVTFSGFTPDSLIYATYQDDNGVEINGPEIIKVASPTLVTVGSSNVYENGNPSMTLAYNGTSCELDFTDGPFAQALAYKNGMAPSCPDITVGDIERTGQYSYTLTIFPSA